MTTQTTVIAPGDADPTVRALMMQVARLEHQNRALLRRLVEAHRTERKWGAVHRLIARLWVRAERHTALSALCTAPKPASPLPRGFSQQQTVRCMAFPKAPQDADKTRVLPSPSQARKIEAADETTVTAQVFAQAS